MQTSRFTLGHRRSGWWSHWGRATSRKLTLAGLTVLLVATAGLPALAKGPDRGAQGGQQRQERLLADVDGKAGASERKEARQRSEGDAKREPVSAEAGGRTRTVTKTFANGSEIAVPKVNSLDDQGPADAYPSTLEVSGFRSLRRPKIVDVNVKVRNLSHTFASDVDLLLVAPNGRNAIVMSDVGGAADPEVTNITLTLDDEAAKRLPEDKPLTSGAFRPRDAVDPGPDGTIGAFPAPAPTPSGEVALATFDGINPKGTWQLFVLDDTTGDIGVITDGWALQLTIKGRRR